MRLLNRSLARSLWFFPTEDLNPSGLDLVPVFAAIQSRYRFQRYPSKPEDLHPALNGIQYGKGAFRLADGHQIDIVSFTIYNDGLVAETRHSSQATDSFLEDVLSFISTNHRLTFTPEMVRKKGYLSEVVVTTDADLGGVNEKFRRFALLLEESNGEGLKFSPISIRFGTDPADSPNPLQFTFERRVGSQFSENRYFSSAALTSDKHLKVLDEWEGLLTAK